MRAPVLSGMTLLALVALIGLSLCIGVASVSSGEVSLGTLLSVSRLPRTFAALLAGTGLALAGVVVQQAVQNRFVEPGLTGTSEAAMLGLLAMTLIAPGAALGWKMTVAAISAMIGTGGFLWLARFVPRSDPMLLPLVGLIYGGILGAALTWIAWMTDLLQFVGIWQLGEFSGVVQGRYELLWIIAGLGGLLYLLADRFTLLGLGEAQSRALGLGYHQTRALGLIIVAAITAVVVVTVGAFPFVGLVIPNIVSRWRGDNLRANLPLIAAGGAMLVLAADIIGRLIVFPFEIPAATIFAVFGSAIFLWLLFAAPSRVSHG
ncbi:MAG: iron ABC transporter permease [Rhodobacteraceae bacterium]|nr:iron ABC transporter permease [Paracoccaceae bacterium]